MTELPLPAPREEAERAEHEALSPLACFSDRHQGRPAAEPPDPYRTCFQRDRDRVLHSGAFRRLKDKTQVFVIDEGDFYRTRLTHTLEVTQMARFLCRALRLNESLGEVLALVHDIGHPPFGHEGERVLQQRSGVPFDHNSQALRIVDLLETPYHDRPGLNLTHVVRRSILKHGGRAGAGAPEWPGAVLEAQVADLADSTAYQHHDLEDALRSGLLTEEVLASVALWRGASETVPEDVEPAQRRKAVLNAMLKASLQDIVATTVERMRQTGAGSAEEVARGKPLVGLSPSRAGQHRELSALLLRRFYKHPRVLRSMELARVAIAVIVDHYHRHAEELPADYRRRAEADGLPRSVCDYVAGMTDRFAAEEARRLQERGARPVRVERKLEELPALPAAPEQRVAALEEAIGHRFRDAGLAKMALTHSSARGEQHPPNERLEFLGDAVLGMLVARQLYHLFPDREEGELSRIKSAVVSRHALRRIARSWRLAPILDLGGGIRTTGEVPASVVADAAEAVLGAVFLDGGLEAVRTLVETAFGPLIVASADGQRGSNHKSELQHWTQGRYGITPHYRVLSEEGPDHEKEFTVAALVDEIEVAVGVGRNKRQAEQRAAQKALRRLEAEPGLLAPLVPPPA